MKKSIMIFIVILLALFPSFALAQTAPDSKASICMMTGTFSTAFIPTATSRFQKKFIQLLFIFHNQQIAGHSGGKGKCIPLWVGP